MFSSLNEFLILFPIIFILLLNIKIKLLVVDDFKKVKHDLVMLLFKL